MILYILKRIIFLIPFIGLALVGFMAIPSRWWTTRKMSIAGLLLLLFYNLFATSRCFPQILCFLNQREGLTQNTNQVTSNNATITQLQQDVEDGITRLQKLYLPKKVKAKSPRMPWDPPTSPQPGPIIAKCFDMAYCHRRHMQQPGRKRKQNMTKQKKKWVIHLQVQKYQALAREWMQLVK